MGFSHCPFYYLNLCLSFCDNVNMSLLPCQDNLFRKALCLVNNNEMKLDSVLEKNKNGVPKYFYIYLIVFCLVYSARAGVPNLF